MVCGRGYREINIIFIKEENQMEDRKEILLRACLELLQKQEDSNYVLDLLEETVFYDGADCDGSCLIEDIKTELGEL